MNSCYGSILTHNSNKKIKNVSFQYVRPSSFNSNKLLKFMTSDTEVTRLETQRSESNEDEIDFIERFFKNKFFALEQNPKDESLIDHKNIIIHKWYILINVFIVILHFQKIQVKRLSISNFSEIFKKKEIKEIKDNNLNNLTNENNSNKEDKGMNYILDQVKLFQIIKCGFDSYEKEIIDLIKKNNFVNVPNYEDHTPLFLTCLHGYENIAKILIDNGANYLLLNSNNESVLDVSVRWNYYNLTKFLLFYCKWPYSYIKNAYKYIKNKEIKKLFRNYKKSNCSCFK